jgi:hypothetical protein
MLLAFAIVKASTPAPACTPTPVPIRTREERVRGIITTVEAGDGGNEPVNVFTFAVRADDGRIVDIQVTPNTILTPLGMRLELGKRVIVLGHTVGCYFIARKITIFYY